MNHDEKTRFIEQLYLSEYENLLLYAKKIIGDPDLALESVQETFVVALLNQDDLIVSPRPIGWLMKTLQYIMKNTKRSETKVALTLNKLYAEAGSVQYEQNLDIFIKYRGIISDDDLIIVIKHYCEGCGHVDIAKELNISTGACKMRISRAIKRLSQEIKKEEFLVLK